MRVQRDGKLALGPTFTMGKFFEFLETSILQNPRWPFCRGGQAELKMYYVHGRFVRTHGDIGTNSKNYQLTSF